MKHYSVGGGGALVFFPDVLDDSLSWSNFDEILKWKVANVGCFIAISNLRRADAFFRGVKATFWIKNVCGKRQDNPEKVKNIYLFLETGKSAVKFWVDAITQFETAFPEFWC